MVLVVIIVSTLALIMSFIAYRHSKKSKQAVDWIRAKKEKGVWDINFIDVKNLPNCKENAKTNSLFLKSDRSGGAMLMVNTPRPRSSYMQCPTKDVNNNNLNNKLCGIVVIETGWGCGNYNKSEVGVHGLWPQVKPFGDSSCLFPDESQTRIAELKTAQDKDANERETYAQATTNDEGQKVDDNGNVLEKPSLEENTGFTDWIEGNFDLKFNEDGNVVSRNKKTPCNFFQDTQKGKHDGASPQNLGQYTPENAPWFTWHEYSKHGICAGGSGPASDYFNKICDLVGELVGNLQQFSRKNDGSWQKMKDWFETSKWRKYLAAYDDYGAQIQLAVYSEDRGKTWKFFIPGTQGGKFFPNGKPKD